MANDLYAFIEDHFATLTDPHRRKLVYPLTNILTSALCPVISGGDDFVSIAEWGRQKRACLVRFLQLINGIPSHDPFNAIFRDIKPAEFERCLLSGVTSLHEVTAGQVVAIDGKTLRQNYDKANAKSAIHRVSACATANHVSRGQVVVDAKSNEITAIPKLLEILDVSGCLVTIDAMGEQTEIAEKIVAGGADYVLAVKGNQPTLFVSHMDDDFARVKASRHESDDKGHGRTEHRSYYVCDVPDDLTDRVRWKGLKQIGVAISETMRGSKSCDEVRDSILSKKMSAKQFGAAMRGHWGIENSLHWQLDVTFGEDACRVRLGLADANLSVVRRAALGLLKNETSEKIGVKNKRLAAACNTRYMEKVLTGS
ncbi:ISAs1 family transposase [Singulisphaera acidiphila]|uniref:Transposase n=1 Tax=Singulisphaera acidiphila (strain ATCC BAA-1392 / DSM 18658 / VKM B-2454 / MOB10) TaxID=886293 RepID=L0DMV7_SINAD|nr:ISAs1 family transposase [Singulisphaera acidiphila]AGA30173.1 transposase [Singulisphaera acidiphila DSM 18658]